MEGERAVHPSLGPIEAPTSTHDVGPIPIRPAIPASSHDLPPHTSSTTNPPNRCSRVKPLMAAFKSRLMSPISHLHARTPYLRTLPLPALLIILFLVLVNLVVWAISALVLIHHPRIISTAALAYTLGLRHALDADHISAIDLMTRRLIASGQRPVTVGTFFSLGHSTIVVITSIVVAATAAGVSKKFDGFSNVGGIIGSSVSAAFLLLLGVMNGYILYRLVLQLKKILWMSPEQAALEAWKIEGGGVIFKILKKLFKVVDRPWKMYPLGILFGLGFDTSSEVALLGISSIQGAKGTSIWLILIFPVLFTVGMCLIDTIDGALMLSLYVKPMEKFRITKTEEESVGEGPPSTRNQSGQAEDDAGTDRAKDPLAFLYYSIVLTALTVIVALVIGTIQLLTMILNVTHATGKFWDGVATAGEYYEIIGGSICASFIVVGIASVICYKPWRSWVEKRRSERLVVCREEIDKVGGEEEVESGTVHMGATKGSQGMHGRDATRSEATGAKTCSPRVDELDDRISSYAI